MTRRWKNFLVAAAVAAFFVLLSGFNATKPRILILNSKPQDSVWSAKFRAGANAALEKNRRPVSIEWSYLDFDAEGDRLSPSVEQAGVTRTLRRFDPDVLVAVDDEANSLVARGYAGRDRPRIIYVSIDRSPEHYGYTGARNVSGIAENLPLVAFRDLAGILSPDRPLRIATIGVDSETGEAELAQIKAFDWSPHRLVAGAVVRSAEEWKDFVEGTDAGLLLVLDAKPLPRSAGDTATVSGRDLVRWTEEHAKALPVGTHAEFVDAGGSLSLGPPPDDFGEKTIQLALDWLDARQSPGAPAPLVSSHFEVAMRQGRLAERGVVLPQVYAEAARENGTLLP